MLDPLGGFLFLADEQLARELVAKHQVRVNDWREKNSRSPQAIGTFEEETEKLIEEETEKLISQKRFFVAPA